MIRPIDIKINAAHPELPLVEAVTYVDSPSAVFVHGVPRSCGNWAITRVYVSATYPDGSTRTIEAVYSAAGIWVATLPAPSVGGRTQNGFVISADGTTETGDAVTGYVLGMGDFAVLSLAPIPNPGDVFWAVRYFDTPPTPPKKGDMAPVDGSLKFYDGTAWVPFVSLADYVRSVNGKNPDSNGNVALDAFDIPLGGSNVADVIDSKVDRDTSASEGNIPVFDSNGMIEDSGKKPTDFALATNIPKTALASDVQTSLDKADTALQTAPVASVNGKTGEVVLTTSDLDYPISGGSMGLTMTLDMIFGVLDGKAPLASPAFTGTPTAPTPTSGDNSGKVATTAFVHSNYAPATKTVTVTATETMLPPECFPIRYTSEGQTVELSADEVEFSPQFVLRVKGASPVVALATFALPSGGQTIADFSQHPDITFGGRTPTAGVWPAYLREGETYSVTYPVVYGNDIEPLAPLASPAFTGTPTAPTPTAGDNTTKVATTAFVQAAVAGATPNLDYVMRVDAETGGIYYTTPDTNA